MKIRYPHKYINGGLDLEITINNKTIYIPSDQGIFESGELTDKGNIHHTASVFEFGYAEFRTQIPRRKKWKSYT